MTENPNDPVCEWCHGRHPIRAKFKHYLNGKTYFAADYGHRGWPFSCPDRRKSHRPG